MELTYKIRGADGQEYGPVPLATMQQWQTEGRFTPETEGTRSDMTYWVPVSQFQELSAASLAAAAAATSAPQGGSARGWDPETAAQIKSSASWFYWIAGLSLVNSLVALSGSDWRFILGMGVTQIIDIFADRASGGGKAIVLVLDLLMIGTAVTFGIFANKGHRWAFIVGMILYALDGIIFVLAGDWLPVAFHAYALFRLYQGLAASWNSRRG